MILSKYVDVAYTNNSGKIKYLDSFSSKESNKMNKRKSCACTCKLKEGPFCLQSTKLAQMRSLSCSDLLSHEVAQHPYNALMYWVGSVLPESFQIQVDGSSKSYAQTEQLGEH